MPTVTMRYWAAAKEAAGVAEQQVAAGTLADALAAASQSASQSAGRERLAAVFSRSSFLVDGTPVGRRAAESVRLTEGNVIEVLPPFAGG